MAGTQSDVLTERFVDVSTRRVALRSLGAGAAGIALGALSLHEAEAKNKNKKKKKKPTPPPGVRLTKNSQTLQDQGWTILTWEHEEYDIGGLHSAAVNSRITVPSTGIYLVTFFCSFDYDGRGRRIAAFAFSDSNRREVQSTADATSHAGGPLNLSIIRQMRRGDFVEVQVYQDTGGPLAVVASEAGEGVTQFAAHRIGTGV